MWRSKPYLRRLRRKLVGKNGGSSTLRTYIGWIFGAKVNSAHWRAYRLERVHQHSSCPCSVLLGYDHARSLHLAATWGPSARRIINLLANPQEETYYRGEVQRAVAKCVRNYNVAALADASDLGFNERSQQGLSSKVFFVRPGENRNEAVLVIPTGEIWKLLTTAITVQSNADLEIFTLMSSHRQTRAAAGWMFDAHMHAKFSMPGAEITLYDKNRDKKIISVAKRIPGALNQLPLATPPFYWQPPQSNFPGIDSV